MASTQFPPQDGTSTQDASGSSTSDRINTSGGDTKSEPAGYPRLAKRMGFIPEQTIIRRFGALNTRNILYLHAELIYLEKSLQEAEKKHGSECSSAGSWLALSQSQSESGKRQWQLVQTIKKKLKEYNNSVIQQEMILRMGTPSSFDLDQVQKYLESVEMGPFSLCGPDSAVWGSVDHPENHEHDLISLLARREEDAFTKWVMCKATKVFFRLGWPRANKSRKARHLSSYDDEDLLLWSQAFTSMIAAALPIGSIIILQLYSSLPVRLVLIAVFNALLSLCLNFFTKSRPVDLFAVAAAFSAVQVAFVQAGIPKCNG